MVDFSLWFNLFLLLLPPRSIIYTKLYESQKAEDMQTLVFSLTLKHNYL